MMTSETAGFARRLLDGAPDVQDLAVPDDLFEVAGIHGVAVLLATRMQCAGIELPPSFELAVRKARFVEPLRLEQVRRVLAALASAQLPAILLKGMPLAYQLYEVPWQRERADTDLMVTAGSGRAVGRAFESLGFDCDDLPDTTEQRYQRSYVMTDRFRCRHEFDVHEKLNNRQVFAHLFEFEELLANSVPVPGISENAHALRPALQLLHAAMHRTTHLHAPYYLHERALTGDRLLWLYEIALLVARLDDEEWALTLKLANDRQVVQITRLALQAAQVAFPNTFGERLPKALQPERFEPSSTLLRRGRYAALVSDVRFAKGAKARLVLLRELCLPAPAYMLEKYEKKSWLWLPLLYVWRMVSGLLPMRS